MTSMYMDAIIELVLDGADGLERGRGGAERAARLREQVRFYRAGQASEIPAEWKPFDHLLDPEFSTYVRLRRKFMPRGG